MMTDEIILPLSAVAEAVTRTGEVIEEPFAGEEMLTPATEKAEVIARKTAIRTLRTLEPPIWD
jgi:hypothetical protein